MLSAEIKQEKEIRPCQACNAWIANDRAFGRMPNKHDSTLCECCLTPEEKIERGIK